MALLTEIQHISTTGARAVSAFTLAGQHWLAIPQLAADAAGSPPGINGGSSDTEVLLLRDSPNGFEPAGTLPVGGGEDAEAFELDDRSFLAIASIRSGSGPYDFATVSPIFVSEGGDFVPFQNVDSFAAKQWRFFRAGASAFLALAQGHPSGDQSSLVLRWDGTRFAPFQEIESKAGYNFAAFEIDGDTYLAHADHVLPARLYRFAGERFIEHQSLLPAGGRAFQLIEDGAERYLAVARIDGDSVLLHWNGTEFVPHDTLPGGPGGREFAWVETPRGRYLIRVDFIHGTPAEPQPDLRSHIYRYEGGRLETVARFRTTGGTDVTVLPGDGIRLAVSNGLAAAPEPGATFAAETVICRFDDSEGDLSMYESPELRRLFSTYSDSKAPGRDSIADHLSLLSMAEHRDDTLIVATATDLAVFPGGGAPPQVQGFRVNIPGFTELTAISHFGPAIASIVAISMRGEDELWRRDAQRLIDDARRVRAANGSVLWRESLRITAFEGREDSIATMVDYACAISERYLARALAEPGYLSPATLRDDLLDGRSTDLPVAMNRIMIATFGLYALDYTHRLVNWLDDIGVDWDRALFAITGRQGRPTAGTSKATTNLARIMHLVSGGRLAVDRIFVAPTMPGFETPRDGDLSAVAAAEEPIRWQLARVMSSAELAPIMYDGYPRFAEPDLYGPDLHAGASSVTEMPRILGSDDWLTMFTRLRLTLEDPRQLLAAGVTDFVAEQLLAAGNDPGAVTVPGLDGEPYPRVALAAAEPRG